MSERSSISSTSSFNSIGQAHIDSMAISTRSWSPTPSEVSENAKAEAQFPSLMRASSPDVVQLTVSAPSTRPNSPVPIIILPERHARCYVKDSVTEFVVENTLFGIHRHFLEEEAAVNPDSTGFDHRVYLPGVAKAEFESLYDFFYKGMHNETAPPLSHWTSLLSISTQLRMSRIRARAIREIENLGFMVDPIDQVVLAVKHNVPEWLPIAYEALCQRSEPLDFEEAEKIGLQTVVKLSQAREAILRQTHCNDKRHGDCCACSFSDSAHSVASSEASSHGKAFDDALVHRIVANIFWGSAPCSPTSFPPCASTCSAPSDQEDGSLQSVTPLRSPVSYFPELDGNMQEQEPQVVRFNSSSYTVHSSLPPETPPLSPTFVGEPIDDGVSPRRPDIMCAPPPIPAPFPELPIPVNDLNMSSPTALAKVFEMLFRPGEPRERMSRPTSPEPQPVPPIENHDNKDTPPIVLSPLPLRSDGGWAERQKQRKAGQGTWFSIPAAQSGSGSKLQHTNPADSMIAINSAGMAINDSSPARPAQVKDKGKDKMAEPAAIPAFRSRRKKVDKTTLPCYEWD